MIKKWFCCLAAVFLILSLTACGPGPASIRYDISEGAQSLDPQFATGETEQLVIYNIFEGLVRQLPSGEILPAAAQSYEISSDSLTYTFRLKPGMTWDDQPKTSQASQEAQKEEGEKEEEKASKETEEEKRMTPVVAEDFVFAFRRIFNQISPSPHAAMFASIRNSDEVLSGELPAESLGVAAPDPLTVVFTLDAADPSFLENLSHSSAMPCSETLFNDKNGRYGSTSKDTPCNGPFRIVTWDNESKIYMEKNPYYYDMESVKAPGVYLMLNRDRQTKEQKEKGITPPTRFELVMEGRAEACRADYEQVKQARKKGMAFESNDGTVWALIFNQNNPVFENLKVRQGFVQAVDRNSLTPYLEENYQDNLKLTDRLIPPAITMFSKPYIEQTAVSTINGYSPETAMQIYREGMKELGLNSLDNVSILVSDENNFLGICGALQQSWQKNLSVFVNIEEVAREDLTSRLKLGDYKIALVPLQASTNTPADILRQFSSGSVANLSGNRDAAFDQALETAVTSREQADILQNFTAAERVLLDTAAAMPLLSETNYFIVGKDVSGIEFSPYGGKIYFKYAQALR